MKKSYIIIILSTVFLIVAIFFIGQNNSNENEEQEEINLDGNLENSLENDQEANEEPNEIQIEQSPSLVEWQSIDGKWESRSTPPECPDLTFYSPVDLTKATSILYPGQDRNGYKPHGGFRFDGQTTNDIEVRAPFDGYAARGARYFASGELQYTVEIVNECGINHRLGHLLELAPDFDALAQKLPEPKEMDSRLYQFENRIEVKKGDLIATKVGLQNNVFMDWGAYDLRKENDASQDPEYREEFSNMKDSAFYALCWFDYLPEDEEEIVRSLPAADGNSGKQSDYCT